MIGELFDPKANVSVSEHFRPHWAQSGTVVFVTFRTIDSIPSEVLRRWDREKNDWLRQNGYQVEGHWRNVFTELPISVRNEFLKRFNRTREDFLDQGRGKCPLRQQGLARIVANSLVHFDGTRYCMGDFVVMPNHVHLLASFADEETMRRQFTSWMHFTARQINRELGERGSFWQEEPFDHLVRSSEQYAYLRQYIAENPKKAHLPLGEYLYRKHPS